MYSWKGDCDVLMGDGEEVDMRILVDHGISTGDEGDVFE
jgi:hypothetical protein